MAYSKPRFRLIVLQAFFAASDLELDLAVPIFWDPFNLTNSQTGIGFPSLTKTGFIRASSRPAILNKWGFTGPNLNAYAQETKRLEASETIPSSIL